MKPDRLVVGLGNPGDKYKGTRHNIGAMVLAELSHRVSTGNVQNRFHGNVVEGKFAQKNILLLCPTTFMNLSGTSVAETVRFFKLNADQILIVCDDLDLPVGKIRMRINGGSGGQKGLKDIIQKVGTEVFPRLRVGIGRPPEKWDTADYVLSGFRNDEKENITFAIKRAADMVEKWIADGPDAAMNQYNA